MKNLYKTISVLVIMAIVAPVVAYAQLTVPQGGTGQTSFTAGYIPYGGSSSLRLDREAAFFYTPSLNRLTVELASTTAITATTICLSGDTCRTTWPTDGGGGGGSISTSTTPTPGNLAFWTSVSALSSVATGTLTETVSGLEFSATRGLVGGAAVLSLSSGYTIPTTTDITNWNNAFNFYTTPSTRITAGNHIDWTSNTLDVVTTGDWTGTFDGQQGTYYLDRANHTGTQAASTISDFDTEVSNNTDVAANTTARHDAVTLAGALDYLTLAGQVITRAAIDLATDITGALGIANGGLGAAYTDPNADQLMFWDDSVGAIKSIATLAGAAISGTTLTINDVTCTDCLGPTEITDSYLLNNGDTGTGAYDFGGATTFEIPNGTAPTATGVGEIAHDTTGNQLIVDDYIVPLADQAIWSVTIASTSPRFISSGNYPVPTKLDGYTITRIQCHVTSGTSKVIAIEDASGNSSEDITCATTNTTDDGSITNPTYTASELSYIDFGATTGAVDYVSISVFGNWTRE